MNFQFATAAVILFGRGRVNEVGREASRLGSRALLVGGKSGQRLSSVTDSLQASGVAWTNLAVAGEPTLELVREGAKLYREASCELVVAVGGGSVLDTGKAIAALAVNSGEPLDYLEVIGRGKDFERDPAPCIAVPTTAGTGSEVTRNAVLGSQEHRLKASLRSPGMLPRVAIVDPLMTLDMPPALTVSTGLDALTQLIEPFVSARRNPMTDMFCLEGIPRITRSLQRAWADPTDIEARTDMSFASLLGGLALANAGLGVVHGFAAPIGGMFEAPHGAVCAALLPHGMAANIQALQQRDPGGDVLRRYATAARLLTGNAGATAEDGRVWVAELCSRLQVPRLSTYGITHADVDELAGNAARANSMKANPLELSGDELRAVVSAAL